MMLKQKFGTSNQIQNAEMLRCQCHWYTNIPYRISSCFYTLQTLWTMEEWIFVFCFCMRECEWALCETDKNDKMLIEIFMWFFQCFILKSFTIFISKIISSMPMAQQRSACVCVCVHALDFYWNCPYKFSANRLQIEISNEIIFPKLAKDTEPSQMTEKHRKGEKDRDSHV